MTNYFYNNDIDKSTYNIILNYMMKNCDCFALVEVNFDYLNSPLALTPTKKALAEYCIKSEMVSEWDGTVRIANIKNEIRKAARHIYRCCNESIEMLRQFDTFFDIENQMDIAFYRDSQCLLYTISHEGNFAVNSNSLMVLF